MVASSARSRTLSNVSVSQVLLHYLELEGVRKVFGVPGAATMDVQYQLHKRRDTFDYVVCRQESGAVYMADAYARATGGLGVVLVTSGPGAAAALTGTTNAEADGTPLLTITGEVGEAFAGKGYLQAGIDGRLNIDEIYAAASDYSAVITNPANARTLIEQALRDARGRPHHAVHLSLPLDVSKAVLPSIDVAAKPANYRTTAASSDPAGAKRMFEALLRASYPLIMLGNGCREALRGNRLARFESFVTRFGIPVITSPEGKGVFPESHPWSLRNFGMVPCEWPAYYLNPSLIDPALPPKFDALAVFASELSEWGTQMRNLLLAPAGPFMQVDLDASGIGRGYAVDLGIVAEAGAIIDELCRLGERTAPDADSVRRRTAFVAEVKSRSPWVDAASRDSTASPMLPQALLKLIDDLTPLGSQILVDCGNSVGWGLYHLAIDPPTEFHIALNVAPMGVAVAGVIGARIGRPLATCVAITGDGAFMMHGNEVSTAAANDVGAIWVVLEDNNLNMVNQGMDHFYPDLDWTDYYAFNHRISRCSPDRWVPTPMTFRARPNSSRHTSRRSAKPTPTTSPRSSSRRSTRASSRRSMGRRGRLRPRHHPIDRTFIRFAAGTRSSDDVRQQRADRRRLAWTTCWTSRSSGEACPGCTAPTGW